MRKAKPVWATREERHQSPMNKKMWLIGLSCGHSKWITCRDVPKLGVREKCPRCEVPR